MAKNIPDPKSMPILGREQISLLEELSNAVAVSGDEGEVRKIVKEEIRSYVDDLKIDSMGNLLAVRKASQENPLRVMVAAHMDEVGFMLVDKEEGGLYKFDTVGGIDSRHLPGKTLRVGKDHLPAVIGAKPVHFTTGDERKNAIALDALRIDLGPGGEKAKAGDRAAFATRFQEMGPSLTGKALDDRLGVAILIELIKHAPPNIDLLAAFTVQEEVGLRGAKVAAYTLRPDAAVIIDATPAHDLPVHDGSENARPNTVLGAGPAIYIADGATLSDPRLIRHFIDTAEKAGIPYQIRQPGRGGTDAGEIHLSREGVPSLSISIPVRYPHTPILLCRKQDWQDTFNLVLTGLQNMQPELFNADR